MIKHIPASAFCIAMNCQTAYAAGVPADGTWGIAFWVFIAYCCLIVIPQAFRAFRFLISPRRGTASRKEEPAAAGDTAT